MRAITAREFAQLCRNDPDIHAQMLAIPNTVTAEKIFDLAERNGYHILPVKPTADLKQIEVLNEDALDRISGGVGMISEEEKWAAFHVWMYHIMGFGDEHSN